MPTQDVVIVGGGLAGLSAAWHLAARGLKPLLLETDPQRLGGRLAGCQPARFEYAGRGWDFSTEHAVHGFWAGYSNLFEFLNRAEISPEFVRARDEGWINRRAGRTRRARAGSALRTGWLPAPLHYLQLFLRPSFWQMLTLSDLVRLPAILHSLFYITATDPYKYYGELKGRTLQELIKHWGPETRNFMIGLTRSGLSANPEEISLSGFLAFMRFYSMLNKKHWEFHYLPDGSARTLIDPLTAKISAQGGQFSLGTAVHGIEQSANRWKVRTASATILARHIILATDASSAQALVTAGNFEQATPLDWPGTMSPAVVRIWFNRCPSAFTESGIFSGEFTVDNYFWLSEIYAEYRRWSSETGGSVLEAHIYGPENTLALDDATLLTQAIHDVSNAFPELRGTRVYQTLERLPPTHTMFEVGIPGRHPGTRSPWAGLYFAGDWVGHPHPSLYMERAVVTGIAAANEVLEGFGLPIWDILPPLAPEASAAALEDFIRTGARLLRRLR